MIDFWSTPNCDDVNNQTRDSGEFRSLVRDAATWNVANAEHANGGGNLTSTPKHEGGLDLEGAAELWQTPGTDSFRSRGGQRKDEMGLDQQSRFWTTPQVHDQAGGNPNRIRRHGTKHGDANLADDVTAWPTPASRDFRSESGEAATVNHFKRPAGPSLPAMIEHLAEPCFLPDQPTESTGDKSLASVPTLPRRLNPRFVEWLQGLPEGWTSAGRINSEVWETWLSRSRELVRFLCS